MPVTAKLSKLFYEQLGEQIANELVDWFNKVDESYKADIREMNELNFARFDAKLDQRIASLDAKLDQRIAALDAKLEQRTASLDAKIDRVAMELHAKIDRVAARVDALAAEMKVRFDQTATKSDLFEFREMIERRLGEQMRWNYAAMATLLIAMIGTLIGAWRR
jgi:hypothetical protein